MTQEGRGGDSVAGLADDRSRMGPAGDRGPGRGTQFWPLGRAQTRAVVHAAYAQTMVNLHLKLGTDFHGLPEV